LRYGRILVATEEEEALAAAELGVGEVDDRLDDRAAAYGGMDSVSRLRVQVTSKPMRVEVLLSTDIYSFKSAKQRTNDPTDDNHVSATLVRSNQLPPAVVPLSAKPKQSTPTADGLGADAEGGSGGSGSGSGSGGGGEGNGGATGGQGVEAVAGGSLAPVDAAEMLAAVEGILSKVDLSLGTGQHELMEENLGLKNKLRLARLDLDRAQQDLADVSKDQSKLPDEFKCPITCDLMSDPVICADGHTYDRYAIERWLSQHGTSPKTNARLPSREVIPNHNLRALIEQFREKHG